nr:ribonuclease H-like domain, reverse transcriptase, RNA-dependent DNA polymerase [Tanacetum cinerariifolium]
MSAMGKLNFFLGLQVLQKKDGIFLSQDKYVGDILKKFKYSDVRSANTPIDKENPWGKDETGNDTIVATSTTEAEYVAAASGCGQVLWIQNQLLDYGKRIRLKRDKSEQKRTKPDKNGKRVEARKSLKQLQ